MRAPAEGQTLLTHTVGIWLELDSSASEPSLTVWLDDVRLSPVSVPGAAGWEIRLEVPIQAGQHTLIVQVDGPTGQERVTRTFSTRPGAARASVMAQDLVTGEASIGRPGDLLLENDRARFVIQVGERPFLGVGAFGGTLVDGDIVRLPWETGHDVIGALSLGLNIENTLNPTSVRIVSDGAEGGPAIVEASGPDDLMPTFNVSSIATLFTPTYLTAIPASADDVDLPVALVNRYILPPGAPYLTWETDITHLGTEPLSFFFGDYVNMTGNVEFFGPGAGFGDVDSRSTCDWFAYLDHSAPGQSVVGYIPEHWQDSSVLTMQGVQFPWLGQSGLSALINDSPPPFTLEPGTTQTFRRWIPVGKSLGDISDVWLTVARPEKKVGSLTGTVTRAGVGVAGARVAVLTDGTGGLGLYTHFVTDAAGAFGGVLEAGDYRLLASLEGSNPPGEDFPEKSFTLKAGDSYEAELEFPASAQLRVLVTGETGAPLPARVSVVGLDPSPDPAGVDPRLSKNVKGVFVDPDRDPLPFGLVQTLFTDAQGDTGWIQLDPGDYALVVSRGLAYDTRTLRVTLEPGQTLAPSVALVRVLDMPDFAGGDFHIHSIDSFDAPVPREERVRSLLAEGLDVFAATDHTTRIDYAPLIADQGASDLLVSLIGEEVTTFDIGHYNIFPVVPDVSVQNLGGIDWAGAAPAGEGFPSRGAYNLSPSELLALLAAEEGSPIIQLNHINSVLHGFFSLQGVDTAQVPPRSVMPHTLFRQDPALPNLFSDDFTAMELWRGYADDPELIFGENLGDVFNLLNQGIVRTWTSNSDTHGTLETPVGGPRNLIGLGEARGLALAEAPQRVAQALREGRVVLSNAPFIRVTLETDAGRAGLEPGLPTQVAATRGEALLTLDIQSPGWAAFDEVAVFVNTQPRPLPDEDDAPGMADYQGMDLSSIDVPRYEPTPTALFLAGQDFDVVSVDVGSGETVGTRLEASLSIPLTGLTQDAWVVVWVRGTDGVSPPLFPVLPANLEPATNLSLDDLLDGNLGEGGILALAITNPLFLDVDGNGRFDPPGVLLTPPQAPTASATSTRRGVDQSPRSRVLREGTREGTREVTRRDMRKLALPPSIRPARYGM